MSIEDQVNELNKTNKEKPLLSNEEVRRLIVPLIDICLKTSGLDSLQHSVDCLSWLNINYPPDRKE